MPGIARLEDGSLLLVFEGFWQWNAHRQTRHHFSVQARRSWDAGRTWSAGEVIFSPPSGRKGINAGAPQVLTNEKTGDIFVSFMTDEDVGTNVGKGGWVRNAEVKVMRGQLTSGAGDEEDAAAGVAGRKAVEFDVDGRFKVGNRTSLWAGLCRFANASWALYGHGGLSRRGGPLEDLLSSGW